ncbi:molybdopterin molybdotransferase MoeA [Rhodococcoides yunnanense]|uniref:Molybdopterin molybdenumtransferase n=1 Tax=Rhodococcoides yunnanense TaxID=278209 RepID=A0ABU4B6G6_9NOCA|nr:gephyrin-like molybdotransferase Glp [Rhodococcus yunnanensis]MDV6259777.1 molybdopterin molybdotransferase MoeA [Rhodococcus yunnanensis]
MTWPVTSSIVALRSVEDHCAKVAGLIGSTPVRQSNTLAASGLVLAEPVFAPASLPLFDNSAVDGYAVHVSDLIGASAESPVVLPVAQHVPAGHFTPVASVVGTVAKIMTGAPVPAGSTGIVPVEGARVDGMRVEFGRPCDFGAHIRRRGEDVREGQNLLASGTVLTPLHAGLLAAVGVRSVPVHRRVRVAVISTGSEIIHRSSVLGIGQIHECNSVLLEAAVRSCGAEVTMCVSVSDSVDDFRAVLATACAGADVVITSGGISAGDHEVVKQALSTEDMEFEGVAMSPGRPQGAGRVFGTAVLSFPGNPLAAYASFEFFARRNLRLAMGLSPEERREATVPLAHAVESTPGRHSFHLARSNADGTVTVLTGAKRHGLGSAADANCFVRVGDTVGALRAGDLVRTVAL